MILFVTGTDTNVGKTVVSAALLAAARKRGKTVRGIKPIESGCIAGRAADACLLAEIANHAPDVLYRYEPPLSPADAARESDAEPPALAACVEHIRQAHKEADFVLVEGAGGLLVPLGQRTLIADLVVELDAPTLVVARDGLGTINHTSLTILEMARRNIPTLGFVFSSTGQISNHRANANANAITAITAARDLGRIPRLPNLEFNTLATAGEPLLDRLHELDTAPRH